MERLQQAEAQLEAVSEEVRRRLLPLSLLVHPKRPLWAQILHEQERQRALQEHLVRELSAGEPLVDEKLLPPSTKPGIPAEPRQQLNRGWGSLFGGAKSVRALAQVRS